MRQNAGLFPQIRLSESPAAKPGFRRFGPSGATHYDRHDESANKSADIEACQIPMLLGSALYNTGAIGYMFTCSHIHTWTCSLLNGLIVFLENVEDCFGQHRLDRAVLFNGQDRERSGNRRIKSASDRLLADTITLATRRFDRKHRLFNLCGRAG